MTDPVGLTSEQLVAKIAAVETLFEGETAWTKHGAALDRSGHLVDPVSNEAVQWCLQGAAWKVTGVQFHYSQMMMAFHAAINQPMMMIQEFEAGSDFAGIKDMLAKAKEYAKKNEPWTPYLKGEPPKGILRNLWESLARRLR